MSSIEETVRRRAYELWEQAGQPEGRSEEFWFVAIAELEGKPPTFEERVEALLLPRSPSRPGLPSATAFRSACRGSALSNKASTMKDSRGCSCRARRKGPTAERGGPTFDPIRPK